MSFSKVRAGSRGGCARAPPPPRFGVLQVVSSRVVRLSPRRGARALVRINTNISAMTAQRMVAANIAAQTRSLEKLATGTRIFRAKDDPSGIIASEIMRADIKKLAAENRVMQRIDGVLSVAEGALDEVSNLLIEAESIAVTYANPGATTDDERDGLRLAFESILNTIDRIGSTTVFNGEHLFTGDVRLSFQHGSIGLPQVSSPVLGLSGLDLEDAAAVQTAFRSATRTIATQRGTIGSFQRYTLDPWLRLNTVTLENTAAAESAIRDTDFASETAELVRTQILTQASITTLQIATQSSRNVLQLLEGPLAAARRFA